MEIMAKYEETIEELSTDGIMNELDRDELQVQLEILLVLYEQHNIPVDIDICNESTSIECV